MPVRITDCDTIGRDGGGPGLLIGVSPRRGRPRTRAEAAPGLRFRFVAGDRAFAWARIGEWWDSAVFVRADDVDEPGVIPPITMPEIRAAGAEPRSAAWWAYWARFFVRALEASPNGPLFGGLWAMTRGRVAPFEQAELYPSIPGELEEEPPPAHSLGDIHRLPSVAYEVWTGGAEVRCGAVFPRRGPSARDEGRVRAWRKRARDGTMPPALLLYLQALGKHLLLDGHARVHAALLEGVEPALSVLWPAREREVTAADAAQVELLHALSTKQPELPWPDMLNRTAGRLYHWRSTHYAQLRGFPIRGGEDAWRADVAARLGALRDEVDPGDVAFCLEQ